jgi:EthD domain
MIKVLGIFKKREDISDEEFREHYENHHVHLFDRYLKMPGVERYVRRYLKPAVTPITGEVHRSGFDVIMEVWCDEEWFRFFFVDQPPEEFRAIVAEDEARIFERDSMQLYVVEESETDLSKL